MVRVYIKEGRYFDTKDKHVIGLYANYIAGITEDCVVDIVTTTLATVYVSLSNILFFVED